MSTPATFLHLSDLHLVAPGRLVSGVDPLAQLRVVLECARGLSVDPDFVVVSGDLSEDGSAESYEILNGLLHEIGGGAPVLLALGNHDDRATFRRVVLGEASAGGQEPYRYSRLIGGLRVIVLDSLLPGEGGGALGAAQLAWLDEELRAPAPRGTLIVLHHCSRMAGPAHNYPYFLLRDAAALEAVVARHQPEVLGVLAGHSHQANAAPFGGTIHATAPAVLLQLDFFASGVDHLPILTSGFNLCQITDGQLVVHPVVGDGSSRDGETARRQDESRSREVVNQQPRASSQQPIADSR